MAIELGSNLTAFRGAEKDDCEAGRAAIIVACWGLAQRDGGRCLIGCGLLQVQLGLNSKASAALF